MTETDPVTLVDVPMPQMGTSVTEGTVLEWRFEIGDEIAADATMCEIATDKVDSEVPCPAAGTLVEILVAIGETVPVGTPLARMAVTGPLPDAVVACAGPVPAVEPVPAERHAAAPAAHASTGNAADTRRSLSPVVHRIVDTHQLDLTGVTGSGRDGRITKKDVLALVEAGTTTPVAAPAAPAPAPTVLPAEDGRSHSAPLSRMRQSIARNMVHSNATAAHAHTWMEVDMSRVERLRKPLGVTALAFVARASIEALRAHPTVNAWLQDDVRTIHEDVHLGIAVALDDEGLIVPVIHNAHELAVEGLAARIRDLATRARSGSLLPDEVQGATFTITNPGRYGSLMAAPIINQPQVAILDLEAIAKRPVVITDASGEDSLGIRPTSVFGLAWDHRAIDGALAAQFLATVRDNLQSLPG